MVDLRFRHVMHFARRVGLALAMAWTAGCHDLPAEGPPYAFELARAVDRTHPAPVLEARQIEREVTRTLTSSSLFSGPRPGGLSVEALVKVLEDEHGEPVLRLHLSMESPPDRRSLLRDGLSATVQVEPAADSVRPAGDLTFAVRRAVAVLEARLLLASLDPPQVATVLQVEDEEILALALEFVARHQVRGVREPIVALLDHPNPAVAGPAVEALGAVGRPEDVEEILARARLADRRHTFAVYEALGQLGGASAEAFLSFAARNEDDPQLAVAAERALQYVRSPPARPRVPSPAADATVVRGHR